jgi:hypothetical protein
MGQGPSKIAIESWIFNIHFVRKASDKRSKIVILPKFLTSNLHFVRENYFRNAPGHRPRLKKETERRARENPQLDGTRKQIGKHKDENIDH